jgi:excisionase family DNA binding protein
MLGVTERTIARWANDRVLRVAFRMPGGARRFSESDVRELGTAKAGIEAAKAVQLNLTSSQAGRLLGVTERTVLRMVDDGRLPATKTRGKHVRIPLNAVESYLAAAKVVPRPRPAKRRSMGWNRRWPRHRPSSTNGGK